MTENIQPTALHINLNDCRDYLESIGVDLQFVTVSGAHIYGFPSEDSDIDLRGCHRLPIEKIIGLSMPNQTVDRSDVRNGIEVDIVSHEVGKYFGLLVKNNGYILEQIFSPIVVCGQSFLDELRPIAKQCVTKNHYFHYRGFFQNQMKLIAKQDPVSAKAILYAYRVLATGIHLMNTGEIETDLNRLADELGIPDVPDLIAAKVAEKIAFKFDLDDHLGRLATLEKRLDSSYKKSTLPETPIKEAVNKLLVKTRLKN